MDLGVLPFGSVVCLVGSGNSIKYRVRRIQDLQGNEP